MTDHEDHPTRASEAFFGRRKGKALRANHARLMETLLAERLVDLSMPPLRIFVISFPFL